MNCKQKTYVIGHKNPDTDSICSAISYAYLKNQIEKNMHKAAAELNFEEAAVLRDNMIELNKYLYESVKIEKQ